MVRLVYTYSDGHTFTTEAMVLSEALAYMSVLKAQATTPTRYVTRHFSIDIKEV